MLAPYMLTLYSITLSLTIPIRAYYLLTRSLHPVQRTGHLLEV